MHNILSSHIPSQHIYSVNLHLKVQVCPSQGLPVLLAGILCTYLLISRKQHHILTRGYLALDLEP
jgi:hypothetical protein